MMARMGGAGIFGDGIFTTWVIAINPSKGNLLLTMDVVTLIFSAMKMSHLKAPDFYTSCVCLGLNRAARVTARRYDAVLKPVGITSGQFSILSALLRDTPVAIGSLAELLGMERTTLKRNLAPLEAAGLTQILEDEQDRRIRGVASTQKGRNLLDEAIPLWQKAQEESHRRINRTAWSKLRPALESLA